MPARKKAATATAPKLPETPHEAAIAQVPDASVIDVPAEGSKVEFDTTKHIVINSKVYDRESFTPEQVQAISAVNYADQHIASAEQDLRIYKYGRDNMVKQLLDDIESVQAIGTVDPPAEAE